MPKAPKNEIYVLLKSLNKAEKRFFRNFMRKRSSWKDTNVQQLFEAILSLKGDSYDEQRLKTHLPRPLAKNLAFEKFQLIQLVIQALRQFQEKEHEEQQCKVLFEEGKILFERGLYESGLKRIGQAKKKAFQYGLEQLVSDILELERAFVKRRFGKLVGEELKAINQENARVLAVLGEQLSYRKLSDEAFLLIREKYGKRSDLEGSHVKELESQPLLQSFPAHGSFESQKLYFLSKGQLARFKGDLQMAWAHYQSLIDLWKAHPDLARTRKKDYKTSLANYLQLSLDAGKMADFDSTLQLIKSIPATTTEEKIEDFQNVIFLEFLWKMRSSNPFQAMDMIPEIEMWLVKYEHQMNQSRMIVLRYNIAVLLFVSGEFQEAHFWVLPLVEIKRSKHRRDIRNFLRVFEVVLLYELERHDTVSYFFRSAYRILKRRQRLHDFEKATLNALRDLDQQPVDQHVGIFISLKKQLDQIKKKGSSKGATGFSEISLWVNAKVMGLPMLKMMQKGR